MDSSNPAATRPGEASWTGSEKAFLPSNTRLPKPWERKPKSPFKRQPGTKAKVWKRYNHPYQQPPSIQSTATTTTTTKFPESDTTTAQTPLRVVKKQRTYTFSQHAVGESKNDQELPQSFAGTFWDRRSSLPRRKMARDDHGAILPPTEAMEEESAQTLSSSTPSTPSSRNSDAPTQTPERHDREALFTTELMSDDERGRNAKSSSHLSPKQLLNFSPASVEFQRLQNLVEAGSPYRACHASPNRARGGPHGQHVEQSSENDPMGEEGEVRSGATGEGLRSTPSRLAEQESSRELDVEDIEPQHEGHASVQRVEEEEDPAARQDVECALQVSSEHDGHPTNEVVKDKAADCAFEEVKNLEPPDHAEGLQPMEAQGVEMELDESVSRDVAVSQSSADEQQVQVSDPEQCASTYRSDDVAFLDSEAPTTNITTEAACDSLSGSNRYEQRLGEDEPSNSEAATTREEEATSQPQPCLEAPHTDDHCDESSRNSERATSSVAFSPVSPRVLLQSADDEITASQSKTTDHPMQDAMDFAVSDDGQNEDAPASNPRVVLGDEEDVMDQSDDNAAVDPSIDMPITKEDEKTSTMNFNPEIFNFDLPGATESVAVSAEATGPSSEVHPASDISDGLTLNFAPERSEQQSTSSVVASTLAAPVQFDEGTTQLEMDTAMLRDFLARSKASRSATFARRTSASHRRDSDAVRNALSSPAKLVLEDKDVNSPSPMKQRKTRSKSSKTKTRRATGFHDSKPLDLEGDLEHAIDADTEGETETIQFEPPNETELPALSPKKARKFQFNASTATGDPIEDEPALSPKKTRRGTRRSTRTTKLPAPAPLSFPPTQEATPAPNKITIKGTHGPQPAIFKTEAQELALVTRNNTRRNKGAATLPRQRLVKLKTAVKQGKATDIEAPIAVIGEEALNDAAAKNGGVEVMVGAFPEDAKRQVHWDQQLVYFERNKEAGVSTITLDTPDELAGSDNVAVSQDSAVTSENASAVADGDREEKPKKKPSTRARKIRIKDTPVKPSPVTMIQGVGAGKENEDSTLQLSTSGTKGTKKDKVSKVSTDEAEKEKEPEKAKETKKSKIPSPRKTRVPRPRAATKKVAEVAPVEELGKGLDAPPAAGTRRRKRVVA